MSALPVGPYCAGVHRNAAGAWPTGVTILVLSGGASRRLGRDKATTHVGGARLLDRLLQMIPESIPIVLVGPPVADLPRSVRVAREDPPGSGPLAAIGAGLAHVETPLVGVLAADMPFAVPLLREALAALAASTPPRGAGGAQAVVPVDLDGHPQQLCAAYRTHALEQALAEVGPLAGRPVRAFLPGVRVMEWAVPASALADVDTPEGLADARLRAAEEGSEMQEWVSAVRDALGIDVPVDIDAVLDVARDAAHGVERPAAPVTTFLMGVAVAGGADARQVADTIAELAAGWTPPQS
jgi:molybdopterin-guanine dinucleotide biosynthesis protein A